MKPGQVAFNAYVCSLGIDIKWDELTDEFRAAFEAVERAVVCELVETPECTE